ncbi:hypothetical protein [Microcoleus asticus]|uniref:Uncharacterized protein n=1 Tax=Microcoleus asticus IPMA8 TaxID=2563858 RepID=A0ABX2D6U3_9CYAN|nr:hypothetical protein [Microcoleus asticus]NQE38367.1 hypothetical protein [Microcoleus asticus IPMA8]
MVSAVQIPLFDTAAAEVGSLYKAGDYVMLRRKPAVAAWVKRGEVYKVNKVHPIDGSLQFWNPFTNQWDFLYPDEVKLAPAPPVIEDTPPPSNHDSVTSVEVAVTELTLPPGNDDSVTSVEVAVTELTLPPGNDDYLPFDPISIYRPRGTAPEDSKKYYRLSYRDGGRVRHQHIRGGNTDSPIAQAKVQEVRSLLAAGVSPAKIAAMLRTSGGVKKTFLS